MTEAEHEQPEGEGPLTGYTVGVTAARRADDLGALIRRRGGTVLYAPALRIVPLADDADLRAATAQLLERAPDVVVTTTAVGLRGWLEAAAGWGQGEELLAVLRRAELLARGPKVTGAVRAAGLTESWSPASESTAEVLDRLLGQGVRGRRIAVQLHGDPLTDVLGALRASGADVVPVPVYRWMPPEDLAPLDRLVDETAAGRVDAVTFTSAPAATSFLSHAERRGRLGDVLSLLGKDVVAACVGPVTAGPLHDRGVATVQPERFRLGPLVQLLCTVLPARHAPGHGADARRV